MRAYIPVPVEAARAIAEQYGKSIVIIFTHDPEHGLMHTTTYGTDPKNKAWAAQGGEIATKALGAVTELATDFEDYRLAQANQLLGALKGVMAQIETGNLTRLRPKTAISPEFKARKDQLSLVLENAQSAIKSAEEFLA